MKSGRDQMVIGPGPDEIYTKRKKRIVNVMMSSTPSSSLSVKYPNDGWGNSLERMSSFTRAEMNQHITNSRKKVTSIQHHSIPTNLKKAKTFLTDQYLKDIEATSDQRHVYFRAKCYHSFKKSEAPHDLRFCLCLVSGQVVHAKCCKAGQVGYCNHVLAYVTLFGKSRLNENSVEAFFRCNAFSTHCKCVEEHFQCILKHCQCISMKAKCVANPF